MQGHTVGLTIRGCAKGRQLTEAAKLLAFSQKPIIEIALSSGIMFTVFSC